jgi:hypothetical protein
MAKTKELEKTTSTKPPRMADVDSFIKGIHKQAEQTVDAIRGLVIRTHDDYVRAAEDLKATAQLFTVVDAKRKSWVEPLKAVAKDIDDTFRPVTKALKEGEELLKEKIAGWAASSQEQLTIARREAAAAAQAGQHVKTERILAQAEALVIPELEGVGVKTHWTGEVLDPELIPREYLMPNIEKLEAATSAAEGDPKIPGWRAFITASIRTSRKG